MQVQIKNENFGPFYYLVCLPYMAFPDDEVKREQLGQLIVAKTAANIDEGTSVTLSMDTFDGLFAAAKSGAASGLEQASIGGLMAGEVLLYLLRMRDSFVPNPSLDKAQHLASAFFGLAKQYSGNLYRGTTRDTVRKNWDKFRPVAHLWAAFTATAQTCREGSNRADWVADRTGMVISMAHAIYHDATTYLPPKARECALVPDKTWALAGIPLCTYSIPPLSKTDMQALEKYKPRQRGN